MTIMGMPAPISKCVMGVLSGSKRIHTFTPTNCHRTRIELDLETSSTSKIDLHYPPLIVAQSVPEGEITQSAKGRFSHPHDPKSFGLMHRSN